MAFFGPGGLSGATSQPSLDPQLMKALMAQYPGLQTLTADAQRGQQEARTLGTLGYQGLGPQFYPNQGQSSFNLSPFESASGVSPESITGGLAMGTFGRSSSQTPMIGAPATAGTLSLPSLQLPMAQVNALQGGMDTVESFGGAQQQPGVTISAGDVLGAGEQIAGLFSPGTGTAFDPGQEMQQPAVQQQRAGERDLSTLGGSFMAPSGPGVTGAEESLFMGGGALLPALAPSPAATIPPGTPGAIPTFGFGENPASATGGSPFSGFDASFGALDAGEAMAAPGGSAATALGSSGLPLPSMEQLQALIGILGPLAQAGTGIQGLAQGNTPGGAGALLQALYGAAANSPEIAAKLGINLGEGTTSALQGLSAGGAGAVPASLAGMTTAALQALMQNTGAQATDVQSAQRALAPIVMALSGMTGGVGAAITFLVDSLMEMEGTAKLKSGAYNNPIIGQLYSQATEGVNAANQGLAPYAGDYSQAGNLELLAQLQNATNAVLPYFQTAEGGVQALRPSDAAGAPGTQSKDEYTQRFTQAKDQIAALTKELMSRGVTYEQLGQLGIDPRWTGLSLDAGGGPQEYYARERAKYAQTAPGWDTLLQSPQIATRTQNVDPSAPNYQAPVSWDEEPRYQTEYFVKPTAGMLQPGEQGYEANVGAQSFTPWAYAGAQNLAGLGSPISTGAFTPDNAFLAALGATGYDPNAMRPEEQAKGVSGQPDVASQQGVASMYGGPFWAAMARMGQGEFAPLIQQNFNPWATWGQMSPEQQLQAMGPSVLGPMQMNKDAGIYGGAWGQVENPRVADFFSGYSPAPLGPGYTPPTGLPPVDLQAQALQSDPVLQQLLRFTQGTQGLTQNADQILAAIQQSLQGAPLASVLGEGAGGAATAHQPAPATRSQRPGDTGGAGGIDLYALLRQLGYVS